MKNNHSLYYSVLKRHPCLVFYSTEMKIAEFRLSYVETNFETVKSLTNTLSKTHRVS